MLRRLMKVLATAAAIVFLPYSTGVMIDAFVDIRARYLFEYWIVGLVALAFLTGALVLLSRVAAYIIEGE